MRSECKHWFLFVIYHKSFVVLSQKEQRWLFCRYNTCDLYHNILRRLVPERRTLALCGLNRGGNSLVPNEIWNRWVLRPNVVKGRSIPFENLQVRDSNTRMMFRSMYSALDTRVIGLPGRGPASRFDPHSVLGFDLNALSDLRSGRIS